MVVVERGEMGRGGEMKGGRRLQANSPTVYATLISNITMNRNDDEKAHEIRGERQEHTSQYITNTKDSS